MRRMDRYKDEVPARESRMNKNQELYRNVASNAIYTNITDVTQANAFEINNNTDPSHTTREAYQQMRKYQQVDPVPRNKKELEDFNYLYQRRENKVYDINSVLENARKNRLEKDEKEEKRKLKNNDLNILSGINREKLEKYREEKKKRLTTPEEDEIRELVDTIASKTLAGEIDKATSVDLLSDLMATNMLDKVDNIDTIDQKDKEKIEQPLTEEIDEIKEDIKELEDFEKSVSLYNPDELKKKEKELEKSKEMKDPDFYTRSMDLSDKDFDLSSEFKEKPLPLLVKILLFILVVALVGIAAYFIYQRII